MDSGSEDIRPRVLDSSDATSSSSPLSDSGLCQVNHQTVPESNVPNNIPKPIKSDKPLKRKGHTGISNESLHKLGGSTESLESIARFSDFTHESSLFTSSSPIQYPPIQVMERGFDPSRIPTNVFSGPSTPVDWSAASNESLFSIRIGNNSFSKDLGFRTSLEVQKPDELRIPTVVPEEEYLSIEADKSRDVCQSDGVRRSVEHISSKQNDKGVVVDRLKEPVIGGTHTLNTKKPHVNFVNTPKVSVFSNKSEHVIQISDFPKNKSSCPMCHCSNCFDALYCCKKPSCTCNWLSCCFKWPSCSCNWLSCCFKWPSCSCKWLSCLTKCFSWPSCSSNCFSCKGCHCTCPSLCSKCPSWPSCNFKCLNWSSCCCKCPSWPSCEFTCCSCWKSKPKFSRYQEDQYTTKPDSQEPPIRQYAFFSCSAYRSCFSCYSSSCCSC